MNNVKEIEVLENKLRKIAMGFICISGLGLLPMVAAVYVGLAIMSTQIDRMLSGHIPSKSMGLVVLGMMVFSAGLYLFFNYAIALSRNRTKKCNPIRIWSMTTFYNMGLGVTFGVIYLPQKVLVSFGGMFWFGMLAMIASHAHGLAVKQKCLRNDDWRTRHNR